jgi:hypothetical protein
LISIDGEEELIDSIDVGEESISIDVGEELIDFHRRWRKIDSIDGGGEQLITIDGGGEESITIDGGEESIPSTVEKN